MPGGRLPRAHGKEGYPIMLKFHSEQGEITVSSAVFSNITGMAATNCFGVKGMAYRSMTDGLVHLLRQIGRASCRERV